MPRPYGIGRKKWENSCRQRNMLYKSADERSMPMYTTLELIGTSNDQPITPQSHAEFYRAFALGVLLTLKADGFLTEMQYRSAESALTGRKCTP